MISIAQRLAVFSHLPGTKCLIPGTSFQVVAYPTRICIYDLDQKLIKEISLDAAGPLKQFTVKQDLQRGCVTVWSEKYYLHILPNLEIQFQKRARIDSPPEREQLSLGSHKKQEWEGIRKRGDFREILPHWFRLGSLVNLPQFEKEESGMFSLLQACKCAIESNRPETILPAFEKLFLAGFEGIWVPRLKDGEFQGILSADEPTPQRSPLYLLQEGAKLIRSLFILTSANEVNLLPHLPPELFAGRMLHLSCPPYGELDLEWSKKKVRRLVFRSQHEGKLRFHCSPLRRFRVRVNRQDRGNIYACGEPLEIKLGCHYVLDQFQK